MNNNLDISKPEEAIHGTQEAIDDAKPISEGNGFDGNVHERSFWIVCGSGSLDPFDEICREHGADIQRGLGLAANSADGGYWEAMVVAIKDGTPHVSAVVAIAAVIRSYLAAKESRKVTIHRDTDEGFERIEAQGYSAQELSQILEDCRDIWINDDDEGTGE